MRSNEARAVRWIVISAIGLLHVACAAQLHGDDPVRAPSKAPHVATASSIAVATPDGYRIEFRCAEGFLFANHTYLSEYPEVTSFSLNGATITVRRERRGENQVYLSLDGYYRFTSQGSTMDTVILTVEAGASTILRECRPRASLSR